MSQVEERRARTLPRDLRSVDEWAISGRRRLAQSFARANWRVGPVDRGRCAAGDTAPGLQLGVGIGVASNTVYAKQKPLGPIKRAAFAGLGRRHPAPVCCDIRGA